MTNRHKSLSTTLTQRLIWIAAVVLILNWVIITVYYTSDNSELEGEVISAELRRLEASLTGDPLSIGPDARDLFLNHPKSYGVALLDDQGTVIDSENFDLIPKPAMQRGMFAEDWVTRLTSDGSSLLVASRRLERPSANGRLVFALAKDPAGLTDRALIAELLLHVWLPILPMALVLIGANAWMIRHGLKPIASAAQWAKSLVPNKPTPPLPDVELPNEVMDLINASQRSLERLNMALALEKRQAAEVAHALRTPLAVLVARLDALPPGEQREQLRADVAALSRTVNQVLGAARADALEVTDQDISNLTDISRSVVAALSPLAHRYGMTLSLNPPSLPVLAMADPDAVELAVSNLIENAIMHVQQGLVEVTVLENQQILVRDHGPGLPPGAHKHMFEPFWRGQDAIEGGSGLGLAIVHRLQLAQNGDIEARQAQGQGTEFILTYQPTA